MCVDVYIGAREKYEKKTFSLDSRLSPLSTFSRFPLTTRNIQCTYGPGHPRTQPVNMRHRAPPWSVCTGRAYGVIRIRLVHVVRGVKGPKVSAVTMARPSAYPPCTQLHGPQCYFCLYCLLACSSAVRPSRPAHPPRRGSARAAGAAGGRSPPAHG